MSLYNRIADFQLIPSRFQPLSPLRVNDYVVLLDWLYRFPQALSAYIRACCDNNVPGLNLPASMPRALAQALAAPLHALFFMSTVLGLVLLWLGLQLYWLLAIAPSRGIASAGNLLMGLLLSTLVFLVVAFCVAISKRFTSSDSWITAFIRTFPSYVAVALLFGTLFLQPRFSLGAPPAFYIGAGAVLVAAGMRMWLATNEMPPLRTLQQGLNVFIALLVVALIGILLGLNLAANDEPDALARVAAVLLMAGLGFGLVLIRPDDYLAATGKELGPHADGLWAIPHVTLLPYAPILKELEDRLKQDWKQGIDNAQRLIDASFQEPYVKEVIKRVFGGNAPDKAVEYAQILVDHWPNLPELIKLAPDGNAAFVQRSPISGMRTMLPPSHDNAARRKNRAVDRKPLTIQLAADTPHRAALAGFWYLRKKYPEKAASAFQRVNGSDFGKEMHDLSQALTTLLDNVNPAAATLPELPSPPKEPKLKAAWQAIHQLRHVLRLAWVQQRCQDADNRRRVARLANDQLQAIQQNQDIEWPAQAFLQALAHTWEQDIHQMLQTPPSGGSLKPVENPFVFAEPLRVGNPPVRRTEALAQLRAAWSLGNLQSLLIHGQSLVGKTSLVHCAQAAFHETAEIIYINLRRVVTQVSSTQLLRAIADEMADATLIPPPATEQWQQNPQYAFQMYVAAVCRAVGQRSLVIVLDEFDQIDSVLLSSSARNHILQYLWGLTQSEAALSLSLITTQTPDELRQELQATPASRLVDGLLPVRVGNFTQEETRKLLHHPCADFTPYVLDEVVDEIYTWTAGQPFLVQGIAYALVGRYNQQIATGQEREPLFNLADLRAVLAEPMLKRHVDVYGHRIQDEVLQGDNSCCDFLCRLSQQQDGLSEADIKAIEGGEDCLCHLQGHDVVAWDAFSRRGSVRVEWLRRWLLETICPECQLGATGADTHNAPTT